MLDQEVDCIVNAWNTGIIPWWLLIPHGVSGAIKKRGGFAPFFELGKKGILRPGQAIQTSAGRLPFRYIIHVASINYFWIGTKQTIFDSVLNAMKLAEELGIESIAFPILGAGTGGFNQEEAEKLIIEALEQTSYDIPVSLVRFRPK